MLTGNVCIFIPFNLFIYLLNICLSTFPLYICLFQPPFKSGNNGTLQKKILTDKLRMPPYFSPEVTSFLKKVICEIPFSSNFHFLIIIQKKMLERDVSKRLGSGKGGAREIKSHSFFKPINWKKLASRNIEPPFRPQIVIGHLPPPPPPKKKAFKKNPPITSNSISISK